MAQMSIGQTRKMCQRVGTSLEAGIDVLKVLQRESQHGSARYRHHLSEVEQRVARGATLAEALRESGGFFPPLVTELVGIGEETGRLETVLLRLADHYEHLVKLRRVFLFGILWPAIQLALAILIIGGVILLPPLLLGVAVPIFGLSGVGGAVTYFSTIGVVVAGLALVAYGLVRGWFGPLPGRLVLLVPGVGQAVRTMALARLSWTLSMALEAGIDAGRAMRLALHSAQLHHFIRHTASVEAVIGRGGQFYEALEKTGAFPVDFITALQNAELSGTESESLARMSTDYQRHAEVATTALSVMASVALWLLIGLIIVGMIVYLFFSLYLNHINEALEFA